MGCVEPDRVPPLPSLCVPGCAKWARRARDHLLDDVHDRRNGPFLSPGITSPAHEANVGERLAAGVGERNGRVLAEADVGLAPVDEDALLPGLDAGGVDVEGEAEAAAAVAVRLHAGQRADAGDERGG